MKRIKNESFKDFFRKFNFNFIKTEKKFLEHKSQREREK